MLLKSGFTQADLVILAGTGGDDDPYTMSWRGIDNKVYYMVDTDQYVQLLNYSGCGNTVSGNHPVTKQLIIDSLRQCALLYSSAVLQGPQACIHAWLSL